jgi:hypothetical protein
MAWQILYFLSEENGLLLLDGKGKQAKALKFLILM